MRVDTTRRISQRDLEKTIIHFTDVAPYSFNPEQSVLEALEIIRDKKTERRAEYFYVVDEKQILRGFVTLSDLLFSSSEATIKSIMDRDVLSLYDDETLEKGLQFLAQHQLLVVPVINRDGLFLGILEIIPNGKNPFKEKKIHYKHLKEDVFQFIGFSIEHRKWNSTWTEYRLRMPWLLCNLAGGLICAAIAQIYSLTLNEFVILSFFIPLVLTLSESISIQSMTLSLRFMHLRRIHWGRVWKRSFVETKSSFMLGATSAILIGAFYFAWSCDPSLLIGICLSVLIAMICSALFGALFPIFLHTIRLDPKVAAGPVILMVADVLTVAIYLSLNTFILT